MTERRETDDDDVPAGDVDPPEEGDIAGAPVTEPGSLGREPAPPD